MMVSMTGVWVARSKHHQGTTMNYYAGIDVSLEESCVCAIDGTGKIVREGAAMDFFVVPTIGFDLLYAFVIVRLDRRDLVGINVTRNPTAAWVARQITEAFPWAT
jgi:hypothetical protein